MAKKPSLTRELAQAAFYQAWFADIPMLKQDQETYQRTLSRYLKRLERLPVLALKPLPEQPQPRPFGRSISTQT